MSTILTRAAQYVRMSTEDQKYSIVNQENTIAAYAVLNGYEIVATFSDPGVSGLDLKHRPGLRALLEAVAQNPPFTTILVLDVSRWGRFQDTDESAYYEFLCRKAGIQIRYCAEPFVNDLSAYSNLLKALKRTMAAEYSRELGAKVFQAQSRLAKLGFKQGGSAPIGYRRVLVDDHGDVKQVLRRGERKNLMADRVILVPGPASEIRFVNNLFRTLLTGRSLLSIVLELRRRRALGRRWTVTGLVRMASHPIYLGTYVYNRTTSKLKSGCRRNPRDQWICAVGKVEPIVPKELFEAVQRRLADMTIRASNEELLRRLSRLWEKTGYLDYRLIDASPITPSASVYLHRFGSMQAALRAVHYPIDRRFTLTRRAVLADIRRREWELLKQNVRENGLHLRAASQQQYHIHVGGAPSFYVVHARPVPGDHPRMGPMWEIRKHMQSRIGRSIILVLSHDDRVIEFVITSWLRKTPVERFRFGLDGLARISLARFKTASEFCDALRSLDYVLDNRKMRGTSSLGCKETGGSPETIFGARDEH